MPLEEVFGVSKLRETPLLVSWWSFGPSRATCTKKEAKTEEKAPTGAETSGSAEGGAQGTRCDESAETEIDARTRTSVGSNEMAPSVSIRHG
mgnify:FL=1